MFYEVWGGSLHDTGTLKYQIVAPWSLFSINFFLKPNTQVVKTRYFNTGWGEHVGKSSK